MTKGWFDLGREDGGPALYDTDNRTSVSADPRQVLVYLAYVTIFIAFILIVPGIRKERFTTLFCVTVSLFVGATCLIGIHGSAWHVASGKTYSYYRSFSDERISATVGVEVGLHGVNISYVASPNQILDNSTVRDINFNEQFQWPKPTSMKHELHEALVKGLPYPILAVLEYFSVDSGGFLWGRTYRAAGDWATFILWFGFALWLLTNILLCAVPRYGAYTLSSTGLVLIIANLVYFICLPSFPLVIHLEGGDTLRFSFGWSYWLVLAGGLVGAIAGAFMAVIDTLFPSKFATILEVDYDTPYRYFVAQGRNSRNTSTANSINNSPHLMPRYRRSDALAPEDSRASSSSHGSQSTSSTEKATENYKLVPEDPDAITEEGGVDNPAFEKGKEDGCEIVNGKRAVTLHDFGKFADANGKKSIPPKRRSYGGSLGFSAGNEVTIDIHDQESSRM